MSNKTLNRLLEDLKDREEYIVKCIFSLDKKQSEIFWKKYTEIIDFDFAIDYTYRITRSKGYYFIGEKPKHPIINVEESPKVFCYQSGYLGLKFLILFKTKELAQAVYKKEKLKSPFRILSDKELPLHVGSMIKEVDSLKGYDDLWR